jgi:4-amino-4-deoxy-L-arabinose transferase and related glycosyltransferases of PMT family
VRTESREQRTNSKTQNRIQTTTDHDGNILASFNACQASPFFPPSRFHHLLLLRSWTFPLLGPDEPRYAQVAREMFLRGDYVTPTLGGHTWFEKPALLYWMEIAAFKIFGVSEWSARLGPAICGLLTIAAIWMLARKVELATTNQDWPGYASWTALIAASCLGLIGFSRGASFDIVITMTTPGH